jgi:hypothetical protein
MEARFFRGDARMKFASLFGSRCTLKGCGQNRLGPDRLPAFQGPYT